MALGRYWPLEKSAIVLQTGEAHANWAMLEISRICAGFEKNMKKIIAAIGGLLVISAIAAAFWLWTPSSMRFDADAAIAKAGDYDVRIIRDKFGVPHIYGERDSDVAFGLAYAHAEDDWKTLEEVLFFARGELARRNGKDAAIPDFLIGALNVPGKVAEQYETDLTAQTRAMVEGYAAGMNLWCAENKGNCAPGAAPVSGQDIIAGFVSRTPFFYGLEVQLTKLFEGDLQTKTEADAAKEAFLRIGPDAEIGSNAMAVAPSRSADGHTRLMANTHQPYEGPVAWYEARLKSEEGWDMIGGLFPGAPMILVGTGPNLGWTHTVNRPDLVDVYKLTVDDLKKPTQYIFDGEWRDLAVRPVKFRVKLFGPFSLPVTRKTYNSVHGPVFVTDQGVFAVSYGGAEDIRSAEQWYRMNKAQNYNEWHSAMEMLALPSFNTIYGDRDGNIAYFYNAAIPVRDPAFDWSGILPGDTSDALWSGIRPFSAVPKVVNPESGYVVNANNTPFAASADADNPDPAAFPPHYGIDTRTTNRGFRIQTLYGGDPSITEEEFITYKMDHTYAEDSRVMETVRSLIAAHEPGNEQMDEVIAVLQNWNGATNRENRSAALAVLTAQKARGYLLDDEGERTASYQDALKEVAAGLQTGFGRVDPEWGEVMQLQRGDLALAIDGGPDTLRAVYPTDLNLADGSLKAAGGDTYILYADWPDSGEPGEGAYPEIRTIHQYGAATLDASSTHYADQAPLFVAKEWKTPPMTLEALLEEATSDKQLPN